MRLRSSCWSPLWRSRPVRPPISPLGEQLQRGGVILVIRHAATDQSKPDQDPVDLNDCRTQRNLSAQGRREARLIGQGVRRLKLRIGAVLSSRFCRTRETARLAFGRATISPALLNTITAEHDAAWRRQIRAARALFGTKPAAGQGHRARHARRCRRGRDRTDARGGRDAGLPPARKQQVQADRPHHAAGLGSPARPGATLARPDDDELVDARFRAPHLAAAAEDLPHVRR